MCFGSEYRPHSASYVDPRGGARLQLLGVLQDLPLLVLEALKLALQFLLLLLSASLFQSRLQFLQSLVEVVLSLGQFFETIQDLPVFALSQLQ